MINQAFNPVLKFSLLPHAKDIAPPAYETAGAAGMDLRAAIPEDQPCILKPLNRILVPTGLIFQIPTHYEAQIRPRSGLALKHGITCLNSPGTIDSDYRGEIKMLLINLGEKDFIIKRNMRIGQMIISQICRAYIEKHDLSLVSKTGRNAEGFGSTGLF